MTDYPVDFRSILDQYSDGPAQLEAVCANLSESNLDLARSPGNWTIRQIVHHIVDGDELWKICIKAALGNHEGSVSLQWYWDRPQAEWAEYWNYATRCIKPSLALFRANRQHIGELIRGIPDSLEKSIWLTRPDKQEGMITVRDVLKMQIKHVFEHIQEIHMIRQAHKVW